MKVQTTVEIVHLLGDLIDLGYMCDACDCPHDLPVGAVYTNHVLNRKTSDLLEELACHIVSWSRGDGVYPLPKPSSASKKGRLKKWKYEITNQYKRDHEKDQIWVDAWMELFKKDPKEFYSRMKEVKGHELP